MFTPYNRVIWFKIIHFICCRNKIKYRNIKIKHIHRKLSKKGNFHHVSQSEFASVLKYFNEKYKFTVFGRHRIIALELFFFKTKNIIRPRAYLTRWTSPRVSFLPNHFLLRICESLLGSFPLFPGKACRGRGQGTTCQPHYQGLYSSLLGL